MTRQLLTALLFAAHGLPAVADTSCHIHPPGSTPENPIGTVGPFDSVRACEEQRARHFGTRGYCHCSADFTPDWKRLDPTPDTRGNAPLL